MFADVEHWPLMFKRFDELPNTDGPPNAYIQDCTNNEGVYASIDDFCVPQGECPFPIRCVEGNAGCREGSTGLLCRACLEGYYKSGTQCLECPENSAASAGVAAFFVVVAGLVGFKAAEALGAVSTNMIKKVVETLQFFSISFSVEIKMASPGSELCGLAEGFQLQHRVFGSGVRRCEHQMAHSLLVGCAHNSMRLSRGVLSSRSLRCILLRTHCFGNSQRSRREKRRCSGSLGLASLARRSVEHTRLRAVIEW